MQTGFGEAVSVFSVALRPQSPYGNSNKLVFYAQSTSAVTSGPRQHGLLETQTGNVFDIKGLLSPVKNILRAQKTTSYAFSI